LSSSINNQIIISPHFQHPFNTPHNHILSPPTYPPFTLYHTQSNSLVYAWRSCASLAAVGRGENQSDAEEGDEAGELNGRRFTSSSCELVQLVMFPATYLPQSMKKISPSTEITYSEPPSPSPRMINSTTNTSKTPKILTASLQLVCVGYGVRGRGGGRS